MLRRTTSSGSIYAYIELRGMPCRLWERRAAGMSSGTEAPKRPVQRLCRCAEGKRLAEEARETNFDGPRPPSASWQPAGGVGSLVTPGTTQAVPAVQAVAPAQITTNGVGLDRFGRGSCFSVWPFVKKGAKVAPGAGGVRGAARTGPRPFAYRQTHNFPESRSSGPHGIPPIYFTRTYTYDAANDLLRRAQTRGRQINVPAGPRGTLRRPFLADTVGSKR